MLDFETSNDEDLRPTEMSSQGDVPDLASSDDEEFSERPRVKEKQEQNSSNAINESDSEDLEKIHIEQVCNLSSKDVDITFVDGVRALIKTSEEPNTIHINADESVLQCCKIDAAALDKDECGIFIFGNIGEKAIPMMIDTGAACCVMSRKIYDSIPDQHKPSLVQRRCGIRSVSGQVMKCHGVIKFAVQFGNRKIPIEFHVADICDKVILGMPFLSESEGTVDTKTATITLGHDSIPCLILDGKPSARKVFITQECIVPPGREVILPARSIHRKGEKVNGSTVPMLFEPNKGFFSKHGLMACAATVMNHKAVVPIRVFNPTEEPVVIKAYQDGIRCGNLTPVRVGQEVISRTELVAQVGASMAKNLPNQEIPEHLQQVFVDACEHLTLTEQNQVKAKLIEYEDVFSKGDHDLGRTSLIEHKIATKSESPIKQRPRPLPPKQSEEVERQVQLLLKAGMISVSDSAWSSPIVCVTKKDGSMRKCCDYRKLNDVTIKDAHPIPPINESIDALSGAKYFCSLDSVSGYH